MEGLEIDNLWFEAADVDNPDRLWAMRNLMEYLWESGDTGESIQVGLAMVDLAMQKPDTESMLMGCRLVGQKLFENERPAEALELIARVLSASAHEFAFQDLTFIYLIEANCHSALGNLDESMVSCENALTYVEGSELNLSAGIVYAQMAELHIKRAQFQQAKQRLAQAIEAFEARNWPEPVAQAKLSMAELLLDEGAGTMGLKYAKEARALWQFLGNEFDVQRTDLLLGRVYEAMGDWQNALRHYKQASATKDSTITRIVAAEAFYRAALVTRDHKDVDAGNKLLADAVPILRAMTLTEFADAAEQLIEQPGQSLPKLALKEFLPRT